MKTSYFETIHDFFNTTAATNIVAPVLPRTSKQVTKRRETSTYILRVPYTT